MFRQQQPCRRCQLPGDARIVEIRQHHDQAAMTHELPNAQHGVQRIGFRSSGLHRGQHRANPRHRADAATRSDRRQRSIREHDQPDLVVVRDGVLGKARSDVRVVAETIELAGPQRTGTTCIDRENDFEMLIFGEVAADQPIAARCRLPIDDVLRISRPILTELQHLTASAQQRARARA
jgi:hypothetical protein